MRLFLLRGEDGLGQGHSAASPQLFRRHCPHRGRPLPPSEGYSYLFTIVDRFSRWPEAVPLQDSSAKSCVRALLRVWISRYGIPDHIISDWGAQFTGTLWHELHELLGIHHHQTTAYHPQANGLVERFHRHLKGALRARLAGPFWMDQLPVVLLGIRASWREDADTMPAQLLYGEALQLPGEMIPDVQPVGKPPEGFLRDMQETKQAQAPVAPKHHSVARHFLPKDLQTADEVYLRQDARRTPLQRPYDGPFRVLERGEKSFRINCNGREVTVSVDRLKPTFSPKDQDPAATQNAPPIMTPRPRLCPAPPLDPDPE